MQSVFCEQVSFKTRPAAIQMKKTVVFILVQPVHRGKMFADSFYLQMSFLNIKKQLYSDILPYAECDILSIMLCAMEM